MKVLVLAADGFEDLELFCPMFRLQEVDIAVTIASPGGTRISGVHGYVRDSDLPIREANPAEYDLLLIPGGRSPERLRLREEAVDIARTFMEEDRPVATIGHGPQLLISAGAIAGRRAACAPGIRDDLRAAGANYSDEAVVVDGNLLSARGPEDLATFCRQLVAFVGVET
jgi:protease I